MLFLYISDDQIALDFQSFLLQKKIPKAITVNQKITLGFINQLSSASLFGEQDDYIINDADFIISASTETIAMLEQSPNNIYCFCNTKKDVSKSKINKQNIKIIKKWTERDKKILLDNWIKENSITIDNQIYSSLISLLPTNPFVVYFALFKLKTIIQNNAINNTDLSYIGDINKTQIIFDILTALSEQDAKKALLIYEQLIDTGDYIPMEIVDIISKQLFYIKLIKLGVINRMNDYAIENAIEFNHFRFINAKALANKCTLTQIDRLLDKFHEIEIDAKINLVNLYFSLKLLLLTNG